MFGISKGVKQQLDALAERLDRLEEEAKREKRARIALQIRAAQLKDEISALREKIPRRD